MSELNDNFTLNAPKDIDDRKGKLSIGVQVPYVSLSEANSAIVSSRRFIGLTVLINNGTGVKEYWYKNGTTNNDLEQKTTSVTGGITSVFGRTTSSITAQTGDYNISQVTNGLSSVSSYSNPSWINSLSSTKVTQDSTHRFVSDTEKTTWNSKQDGDSDLTSIAALSPANNDIIQRKSGVWVNRTMAQIKIDLNYTKSDIGLGNVDNTSDLSKPISTATQTALDSKQASLGFTAVPNTRTINGKALTGNITLDKIDIGLSNVDNTSDSVKNAATATLTNKTISGSSNTITNIGTSSIVTSAITYSKFQDVGFGKLLGNPTGVSTAVSEISLGTGLSFSGTSLQVTANTTNQKVNVLAGGVSIGTRKGINLIQGANTTITVVDDNTNDRVNVTIDSAGGGGGGAPGGSSGQLQYNNASNFGGTIAGVYTISGSLFTYTAQVATDIPFTVKGAASQSGDLFRAVNNSGTILAKIASDGTITGTNLSGTNTGNQTITLTGDVTGSGTGSFAATIANSAVTSAKFRDSVALSLVGRSSNSTGVVGDIVAGTDGYVLRRSGTSLAFGQLATLSYSDTSITYAKIQDVTTQVLLGRYSLTNGVTQEITIGSGLSLDSSTGVLSVTGGGGSCTDNLNVFVASPFTTIAAGTSYIGINGTSFGSTARVTGLPISGNLKNLIITLSGTQPGTGSLVFTVVKNGVDTALIVTISSSTAAGTDTIYSNTSDIISVNALDKITLKVVNNASSSSLTINTVSLLLTN